MWFRRLEYPRAQTYAIPYITECFYAVSVILIALLVMLNVVLVGNDVVTTLKKDPNNIESKWWAPRWIPAVLAFPTTPGPCQPFKLPQQSTSIRTTSDLPLFAYTILNGLSRPQNGSLAFLSSMPYRSEPLRNCTVQNMTALINFQDRGHRVTSQIICNISSTDPDTPSVIKLSTTFSRMANTDLGTDDIVDYISSYAVPQAAEINKAQAVIVEDSTPALKMLGVLDAIGSDMLKAFWALKWTRKLAGREGDWPDQGVVKWSYQANCSSAANGTIYRCRNEGERVEGIDTWYSNTQGAQDFNATYFRGINATIYNYMVALRDALHLDLGNIDPQNNVFLNPDAFKSRIIPDPYMSLTAPLIIGKPRPGYIGPYTPDQFWRTCTWGWGCANGTWTEAILNNASIAASITSGLPVSSLDTPSSVAIDVDYVCPVFRAKPIGSLLVSVFIGTFSMYTALYGIFLFFMPRVDEMYRRERGLRRFSFDDEEDYGGQHENIIYPYQTSPQSTGPYTKAFDASGRQRYSTDSVSRYDPLPNSNVYRPTRGEGSSLPAGACLPMTGTAVPPSDVLLSSAGQFVYMDPPGRREPHATGVERPVTENSSLPAGAYLPVTGTAVPPSDVLLSSAEQFVYMGPPGRREPRIADVERSVAENSSLPAGAYLPVTGTAAPPSDVLLSSAGQFVYMGPPGRRESPVTDVQRSIAENSSLPAGAYLPVPGAAVPPSDVLLSSAEQFVYMGPPGRRESPVTDAQRSIAANSSLPAGAFLPVPGAAVPPSDVLLSSAGQFVYMGPPGRRESPVTDVQRSVPENSSLPGGAYLPVVGTAVPPSDAALPSAGQLVYMGPPGRREYRVTGVQQEASQWA